MPLIIGTFKETEKALREYLDKETFSQSFIIAGWNGIGKRALVEKVAKDQIDDLPLGEFSFLNRNDIPDITDDIYTMATKPYTVGTVIKVDINYDSDIRLLLKSGLKVHLMKFDVSEWLLWAKSINEDGKSSNIDSHIIDMIVSNHSLAHSNIEKFNKIEEKYLNPTLNQVIRGFKENFILNLPIVLENYYKNCLSAYISKKDVEPQWRSFMQLFETLRQEELFSASIIIEDESESETQERIKEKEDELNTFRKLLESYIEKIKEDFF